MASAGREGDDGGTSEDEQERKRLKLAADAAGAAAGVAEVEALLKKAEDGELGESDVSTLNRKVLAAIRDGKSTLVEQYKYILSVSAAVKALKARVERQSAKDVTAASTVAALQRAAATSPWSPTPSSRRGGGTPVPSGTPASGTKGGRDESSDGASTNALGDALIKRAQLAGWLWYGPFGTDIQDEAAPVIAALEKGKTLRHAPLNAETVKEYMQVRMGARQCVCVCVRVRIEGGNESLLPVMLSLCGLFCTAFAAIPEASR
jgi:hypothetical protein